jgi:hypothetical protein
MHHDAVTIKYYFHFGYKFFSKLPCITKYILDNALSGRRCLPENVAFQQMRYVKQ